MRKIKTKNRRAFTLMELLIVVIVIGVLAAVTLPKFNRVIENRKVTEAEEMMSAVRTEQERRCSLDKNYTTNFDNLKDIIASNNTKNYTYSLQPQGISAQSNSSGYTLKILSYEDGSYCCEGEGCKKLNKNYPDCSTLSFPNSVCIGEENDGGGLGEDPTRRPEVKECTTPAPASSETCSPCGETRTRTVTCVDGEWEVGAWSASCKTQEQCPITCPEPAPDRTEECPCGEIRTRSVTCGADGQWVIGEWDKECATECGNTCTALLESGESFCSTFYGIPEVPYHSFPAELGYDYSKAYSSMNPPIPRDYYYTKPEECCCQNQCPEGEWWNPYDYENSCSCTPICDLRGDGEWNPVEKRCCSSVESFNPQTGKCERSPWKLGESTRGVLYYKRQGGNPKVYRKVGKSYSFFEKNPTFNDKNICSYVISDSYEEFSTECPTDNTNPCSKCDPSSDTCDIVALCYKRSEYDEMYNELNRLVAAQDCTMNNYADSPNARYTGSTLGWESGSRMAGWIKNVSGDSQYCVQDGSNCYRPKGTICDTPCGGEAYGLDCKANTYAGFTTVGKMCVLPLTKEISLYECVKN